MSKGRFVISKALEVVDKKTKDIKICPVGRMATSVSLKTAIELGNRAYYDSVISERRNDVKPLSGRKGLLK
jgi:hypothetical protein